MTAESDDSSPTPFTTCALQPFFHPTGVIGPWFDPCVPLMDILGVPLAKLF